ncbi:hypothetical protein SHANETTE_220 [Bacillus phage Shanette]|uniref:Uncharacterized protein n=1 Tax=Bacillus phage Shanette TaxID=1296656 RepID=S5M5D2_9CAUD|nr:hypothetical protein AVV46_gp077 [Bacillus phage Shanette]AGR47146.1 hypothetical protein SHANETTE_220 [Bacillus phage Shanette]
MGVQNRFIWYDFEPFELCIEMPIVYNCNRQLGSSY